MKERESSQPNLRVLLACRSIHLKQIDPFAIAASSQRARISSHIGQRPVIFEALRYILSNSHPRGESQRVMRAH